MNSGESADDPGSSVRACPWCAEPIKPAAIVCRYCNRDVTPTAGVDTASQPGLQQRPPTRAWEELQVIPTRVATPASVPEGRHIGRSVLVAVGASVAVVAVVVALALARKTHDADRAVVEAATSPSRIAVTQTVASNGPPTVVVATAPRTTTTTTATTPPTTKPAFTIHLPGQPIVFDGFQLTLGKPEPVNFASVVAGNQFNAPPAAGGHYVRVRMAGTYRGSGQSSGAFIGTRMFLGTGQGDVFSSAPVDDVMEVGLRNVIGIEYRTDVVQGGTFDGYLYFVVPVNASGFTMALAEADNTGQWVEL